MALRRSIVAVPTRTWPARSTAFIAAAKCICACRSGSARWHSARSWGRFLTRYVAIPFGGAYLALEFAYHVLHLLQTHVVTTEHLSTAIDTLPAQPRSR